MQRFKGNLFFKAVLTALLCFNTYALSPVIEEVPLTQNSLISDADEFSLLEAEKYTLTQQDRTKVTIRTNVPGALVYLNGILEGNSTLVINNLSEGRYNLKVEKEGYETKRCRILVRRGEEASFYIELKKYQGQVSFYSTQTDTQIFIDGTRIYDQTVLLEEGKHSIEARKFGFKSQAAELYVFKDTWQLVKITLEEAPFELTSFRSNRTSFNPHLSGAAGKIKFSFSVTNKEKAELTIKDSQGNVCAVFELPEFTSWEQSLYWDGQINSTYAAEGKYTASIKAG